ncbi:metallophosphoesterase family protein [Caldivirga sp.]|uniref:metallophosphoesterase family protein n=1 Tax=Caldivirga sp. TaxID=2080243 RepID=UPI003D14ADC4
MDKRGISAIVNGDKWLILADTHVGMEFELQGKGVRVPTQTSRIVSNIVSWAEEEGSSRIMILGDVKHELPYPIESINEVKSFIENLSKSFEEVVLVAGNHDGGLEQVVSRIGLSNVKFYDSRGFMANVNGKKALLMHGNSKPNLEDFEKAEVMVMGHTHPAVVIQDEHGFVTKRPAILKIRIDKGELGKRLYGKEIEGGELNIIVLPTANHLTIGVDVASTLTTVFDAPRTILRYVEPWRIPDKIEIYLTDLTYLGTLDIVKRVTFERVNFDSI